MMITIFSILPALFYIFLVYLSTPYGSIDTNKTPKYIFGGFISALSILAIGWFLPTINDDLFLDYNSPIYTPNGIYYRHTMLTEFFSAFFQAAAFEETMKFLLFYLLFKYFSKTDKKSSMYIIFSCMLIGAGFAMQENIVYAIRSAGTVGDTLLIRSFSAVFTHMVCGIIMGYFIAMGNRNTTYTKDISEFSIWMKRNTHLKKFVYSFFGIMAAIILHGIYDFNLFTGLGYLTPITILELTIAYFLFRDLKRKEFIR